MTKVRVIVLDGVDWRYVTERKDIARPLWDLVGLDEAKGCAAMLRACAAPITPSAVCALLSGRDDGIGWFSEDRYTTSQELIRTKPWFREVAREGLTVGLCNVPLTWPAFPMPKGSWLTSGFPVDAVTLRDPTRPWRWPASLDTSGYPIEGIVRDAGPGGSRDVVALQEAEVAIVDWFLATAPRADVEFIWLRSSDSAGHHFWGKPEYDATIGHVCRMAERLAEGAENVIVISDHGFDGIDSGRCEAYHRTSHGPASRKAGLCGAHSEEGILFARGDRIFARGILAEQKLTEVAGGIFDLLQLPPAPGMIVGAPAWSAVVSAAEASAMRDSMAELGYGLGDEGEV